MSATKYVIRSLHSINRIFTKSIVSCFEEEIYLTDDKHCTLVVVKGVYSMESDFSY